jgi:hypothetical protein
MTDELGLVILAASVGLGALWYRWRMRKYRERDRESNDWHHKKW